MITKSKRIARRLTRSGLSLARKNGEQILITLPDGETIMVTQMEGKLGRAKLHIAAPESCRIVRAELLEPQGDEPEHRAA